MQQRFLGSYNPQANQGEKVKQPPTGKYSVCHHQYERPPHHHRREVPNSRSKPLVNREVKNAMTIACPSCAVCCAETHTGWAVQQYEDPQSVQPFRAKVFEEHTLLVVRPRENEPALMPFAEEEGPYIKLHHMTLAFQ